MSDLKPIIIINAGRSGSQFIVRMLQECNNSIEINHEFNLLKFKPELVKYNFYKNQQSKIKLLNFFIRVYFFFSKVVLFFLRYSLAFLLNLFFCNDAARLRIANFISGSNSDLILLTLQFVPLL